MWSILRYLLTAVLVGFAGVASAAEPVPTFERNIEPLLSRYGCNSGPCHGKARGQNGFALSLLGYDPDFDYAAIVSEARGRRLFPADPESSLLLVKASGAVAHGGGRKLPKGTPEYERILRWIQAGTPRTPADAPKLVKITVFPTEKQLRFNEALPLKVTAHFTDGSSEDVTKLSA